MNLEELQDRASKNIVGIEDLSKKLQELETKLQDSSVWNNQKLASEIGQEVRELKDKISLCHSSWSISFHFVNFTT